VLRRRMCARCHGAREPTRPGHEAIRQFTARGLEKLDSDCRRSSQGKRPSRARKRQERLFNATSEEVLGCAACFESKASWLTLEFTCSRRRAKPAVGCQVQRRVRPHTSEHFATPLND